MILRLSTANENLLLLRHSLARIPGTARILRALAKPRARKMRAVPGAHRYWTAMILSLYNDESSESHYQRFLQEKVLARLRGLEERALREGLQVLDPAFDILIP